jgi:hypothetical protein
MEENQYLTNATNMDSNAENSQQRPPELSQPLGFQTSLLFDDLMPLLADTSPDYLVNYYGEPPPAPSRLDIISASSNSQMDINLQELYYTRQGIEDPAQNVPVETTATLSNASIAMLMPYSAHSVDIPVRNLRSCLLLESPAHCFYLADLS